MSSYMPMSFPTLNICNTFLQGTNFIPKLKKGGFAKSIWNVLMKRPHGPVDYNNWSREQLISRIQELESTTMTMTAKKKVREGRPFDFSVYPKGHVALKVAYFGWNYNGFASQRSYKRDGVLHDTNVITVEDLLFEALMRTKLIESPATCRYARCGRTDAGVSSVGQIVSLTMRISAQKAHHQLQEKDYSLPVCSMLNRNLPPEIRVLGWSHVPDAFDARFSCQGRRYKYFFSPLGLDTEKMSEAAAKLVGEHDFRHFARRDPNRPDQSTVRHIFTSVIQAAQGTTEDSGLEDRNGLWEYEVHGSAFLYHQVRCIMQLLLLVGKGLEPVELFDQLLRVDPTKAVPTPQYEIASEIPLVLTECYYGEPLVFHCDALETKRIAADIFSLWRDLQAKSAMVSLIRGNEDKLTPFLGKPTESKLFDKLL